MTDSDPRIETLQNAKAVLEAPPEPGMWLDRLARVACIFILDFITQELEHRGKKGKGK